MDFKALAEELFHIMTRTAKLPFQKKLMIFLMVREEF